MADKTEGKHKGGLELGSLDSKLDKVDVVRSTDKSDTIKNKRKPVRVGKAPVKTTVGTENVSSDQISATVMSEFDKNSLSGSYEQFAQFDAARLKQVALHDIQSSITQERTISRAWAPKLRSLLPQALYGKPSLPLADLSSKSAKEKAAALNEQTVNLLSQRNRLNIDQYIRDKSDELVRDRIGQVEHRESITVLSQIFSITKRNNDFFNGTFRKYLMKSIELKYKHIFVSKDILAHTKLLVDITTAKLDAIKHNSSLPEAALESSFEVMARKLMTDGTGIVSTALFNRVRKPINDMIEEAVAHVGDRLLKIGTAGMNHVIGNVPVEYDSAVTKPGTSSDKFSHRVVNKLRKGIHGIKEKSGYIGRSYGNADMSQSGAEIESGNIKGAVGGLINHALSKPNGHGALESVLNKGSFDQVPFDLMTRRSIVDIIPGFLGKIHHQSALITKMMNFSIKKTLGAGDAKAFDAHTATDELVFDRDTETFLPSKDFGTKASSHFFGDKNSNSEMLQPIIKKMHTGFKEHGGDDKAFKAALPGIVKFITNITTHAGVIKLTHIKKYLEGGELSPFEQGYLDAVLADIPKSVHKKILKIVGTTFFKDKELNDLDIGHTDNITKSLHEIIEVKEDQLKHIRHAKAHGDLRHLPNLVDQKTGNLNYKAVRKVQHTVDHKAISESLDHDTVEPEHVPTAVDTLKTHVNKETITAGINKLRKKAGVSVDKLRKGDFSEITEAGKNTQELFKTFKAKTETEISTLYNKLDPETREKLEAHYHSAKRKLRDSKTTKAAKAAYTQLQAQVVKTKERAQAAYDGLDPETKAKLETYKGKVVDSTVGKAARTGYARIHKSVTEGTVLADTRGLYDDDIKPKVRYAKVKMYLAKRKMRGQTVGTISTATYKVLSEQVTRSIEQVKDPKTRRDLKARLLKAQRKVKHLTPDAVVKVYDDLHEHVTEAIEQAKVDHPTIASAATSAHNLISTGVNHVTDHLDPDHSKRHYAKAKLDTVKRKLRGKTITGVTASTYNAISTQITQSIEHVQDPQMKRDLKARLLKLRRSTRHFKSVEAATQAYDTLHEQVAEAVEQAEANHPLVQTIKAKYLKAKDRLKQAKVPVAVSSLYTRAHTYVSGKFEQAHEFVAEHPIHPKHTAQTPHAGTATSINTDLNEMLHDHFSRSRTADNVKIRLLSKIAKRLEHGVPGTGVSTPPTGDGSLTEPDEYDTHLPKWARMIKAPFTKAAKLMGRVKPGFEKYKHYTGKFYKGLFGLPGKGLKWLKEPGSLPSKEVIFDKLGKTKDLAADLIGKSFGIHKNVVKTIGRGMLKTARFAHSVIKPHLFIKERWVDVYKKDEVVIGSPLLKGLDIKAGKYVHVSGAQLRDSYSITGPIMDGETQQTVITAEDIKHGLVDHKNEKLTDHTLATIGAKVTRKLLRAGKQIIRGHLKLSGKILGAGADGLTTLLSHIPGLGRLKGITKRGYKAGHDGEAVDSKLLGMMVTKHLVTITDMLQPIAEKFGYTAKQGIVSRGLNRLKRGVFGGARAGAGAAGAAGTGAPGATPGSGGITEMLETMGIWETGKALVKGGLKRAGGAIARGAMHLVRGGGSLARGALSLGTELAGTAAAVPLAIGVAAAAVAGGSIYYGYQLRKGNDRRISMVEMRNAAYHAPLDKVTLLARYEEDVAEAIGKKKSLSKSDQESYIKKFGLDPKDKSQMEFFTLWITKVFEPVFLRTCQILKDDYKLDLANQKDLTDEQFKAFAQKLSSSAEFITSKGTNIEISKEGFDKWIGNGKSTDAKAKDGDAKAAAAKEVINKGSAPGSDVAGTGLSLAASHKSMLTSPDGTNPDGTKTEEKTKSKSWLSDTWDKTKNAVTSFFGGGKGGADAAKDSAGVNTVPYDTSYKPGGYKQKGGGSASNWSPSPSESLAGIMGQLMSLGWTREQAAGIAANIQKESGGNPNALGDGDKAYGIAQWHPDRQAGFKVWSGKDIKGSSVQEQVAFINHELRKGELNIKTGQYNRSAGNALLKAKTAKEAGEAVSIAYERPRAKEKEATERGGFAENLFKNAKVPGAEEKPKEEVASSGAGATPESGGKPTEAASTPGGESKPPASIAASGGEAAAPAAGTGAGYMKSLSDKSGGGRSDYVSTPAIANVNRTVESTTDLKPAVTAPPTVAAADPNSAKQTNLLTEQNEILRQIAAILNASKDGDKNKNGADPGKANDPNNPMLTKLDGVLTAIQGTNAILAAQTSAKNTDGKSNVENTRYIDQHPGSPGIDVARIRG